MPSYWSVRLRRGCPAAKYSTLLRTCTSNILLFVDEMSNSGFQCALTARYFLCPVAATATCNNVRCGRQRTCLTELETNKPRCSMCQFNCKTLRVKLEGPVCGSDNRTYSTWCHMMQQSCNTGVVIETIHDGACEGKNKKGFETVMFDSLGLNKHHTDGRECLDGFVIRQCQIFVCLQTAQLVSMN